MSNLTKRKNSHAWCPHGPHCTTHAWSTAMRYTQVNALCWTSTLAAEQGWQKDFLRKNYSKAKLWLEIWFSFQKIIQTRHRSSQWRLVDICRRRNKHMFLLSGCTFFWLKKQIPPLTTVMFLSFASRGFFSLQELVPLNAAQDTRRLAGAMTGWNTHIPAVNAYM